MSTARVKYCGAGTIFESYQRHAYGILLFVCPAADNIKMTATRTCDRVEITCDYVWDLLLQPTSFCTKLGRLEHELEIILTAHFHLYRS
jgi:hypothetical protein